MKIVVLASATETLRGIQRLLTWADVIYFAYAWMTEGAVIWKPAWLSKIERGVVGIADGQTSVRSLERFYGMGCPVRMRDNRALFHPKIIIGIRGREARVVFGSSNFTKGGLSGNDELNVELSGKRDGEEIAQLISAIESWYDYDSLAITAKRLVAYREFQRTRVSRPRVGSVLGSSSGIFDLDWADYFDLISSKDGARGIRVFANTTANSYIHESKRCQAFLFKNSLGSLKDDPLAYVAGFGSESGYFGGTFSAGHFKHIVKSRGRSLRQLSDLLDRIPRRGPIDLELAEKVSQKALGIPGVALGCWTRLLIAKRPDVFLPINKGSRTKMRESLGPVPAKVSSYFNLLRRIQASPWWRAEPPRSVKQRDVWERRVALLDAVFYTPR